METIRFEDFYQVPELKFDISKLRKDLEPYGLLQFVRSGRISVTKAKMGISEILNTFKKNN